VEGTAVSWERRLRDMVLAGGALAAAACSDSSQSQNTPTGPTFCCNANPDPCCPYLHCGEPLNAACACKLDGGVLSSNSGECSFVADAGPTDAAIDAVDAGAGADADANVFCCNANPDPCCPSMYCNAPPNAACDCKMAGGTWTYGSDGGCAFPPEAGPSDASVDGDGHD
jgi:hypothetical protein